MKAPERTDTTAIREVEQRQRRKFRFPILGIAQALSVTLRTMLSRAATVQYPEERIELPERTRGVIALLEENCTVCMLCSKECPCWCIYIEGHKVTKPGRRKPVNELDRFAIDFGLCMYCGICVEVCPFDALHWSPFFEYTSYTYEGMIHEAPVLEGWQEHVLPPPELVADADEKAKEQAHVAHDKRAEGIWAVIREADKKDAYLQKLSGVVAEAAPAPAPVAAAPAAAPAPAVEAPAPAAEPEAAPSAAASTPAAAPDTGGLPRVDPNNLPAGIGPVERGRLKKLAKMQEEGRTPPADLVANLKHLLDQMS